MQRLLDQDPRRVAADQALELLRAAVPYEASAGQKQRVRAALLARRPRQAPLPRAIVALVALLVLISFGAIASARLGHWPAWVVRAYEHLVPAAAGPEVSASEHHVRRARVPALASAAQPPVAAPALSPVSTDAPALARALAPAPSAQPARRRDAGSFERTHTWARRVAPDEARPEAESAPVLAAMQALRRDHNPVRARGLLAEYLARHPNGALAEEALAMSIEAAAAHGDADAAALASRYLDRYPTGPFRGLARQTLHAP
jgi:hypothetical protein